MFIRSKDGSPRDYDENSRSCFDVILRSAGEAEEPQYGSDELILDHHLVHDGGQNYHVELFPPRSMLWHDRQHHVWQMDTASLQKRIQNSQDTIVDGNVSLDARPEFTHRPIRPDSCDFRILSLLPHHGNPSSPLFADLSLCSLYLHNCYVAVRYSRGSPALTGSIVVNSQRLQISKNLEVFLQYIRHYDLVRSLWIREICVNKDNEKEASVCFNFKFQKIVEDCSCGIILLNRVMETLEGHGLLQRHFKPKKKVWDASPPGGRLPKHTPLHLGRMFPDMEPTFTYKYLPLDLVADEVRLLVIPPAKDPKAPLVADLTHEPMHGGISYEALSYVWGDPHRTKPITVSGQIMHITSNLDAALRDLRLPNAFLVVWIDAICIDQENDRERSSLIPRMQEIYDAAGIVFAWLGPKKEYTDAAFGFVKELYQPELTAFEQETPDSPEVLKRTRRLAKAWAATYELMHSAFLRRRWIIQELASATVVQVVTGSGKEMLQWHSMQTAAETFWRHWTTIYQLWKDYDTVPEGYREIDLLEKEWICQLGLTEVLTQLTLPRTLSYVRRLRAKDQPTSFLLLAILSQGADCADPRDRIYALWNIASDCRQLPIHPDYSRSMEDVYLDFVKAYATYHGSLDIICATQTPVAGMSTPTLPGPVSNDLPAWCPDWRQDAHLNTFVRRPKLFFFDGDLNFEDVPPSDYPPHHADRMSEQTDEERKPALLINQLLPFSFEDRYLTASGVIVDTVAHISHYPIEWFSAFAGPPSEWLDMIKTHLHSPNGFQLSESEILDIQGHATSMFFGEPPGSVIATRSDDGSTFNNEFPNEELNNENYNLSTLRGYIIKGRRFIITEKGYMGLAPWYVRQGFKLAILLGCSVPVVLEEVEFDEMRKNTEPGLYFRGDCFVQGWMEGQTLRAFGETTEEAWENVCLREKLRIL